MDSVKTGDLTRIFEFDRADLDEEKRTVRLSFSSETPVERWFGDEVLSHNEQNIRLGRLNDGAPLLWNHNLDDQVGRVESATIENRRGKAVVRFSKSQRAEELYQDVLDGIVTNVSVGYRIHEMEQVEQGHEVYIATDWEPHEISMVSSGADASVGVGRSRDATGTHTTRVVRPVSFEEPQMTEETKVDVQAIRDEERSKYEAEQQERIRTINDMAKDAPYLRELADKALEENQPLDVFQRAALEATKQELKTKPVQNDDFINNPVRVDLTPKEQKSYSFMRAIQASASNDWSGAGFEKEVSDTIAQRQGASSGGFYIPTDMSWGTRDLTVGTDNAGGYLVGTDHMGSDFIAALRAKMVAMQAGARLMSGLVGNIAIPKIATGTAVGWVAEAAAPTEGQPVFAQISLSGKAVVGYVQISRNLLVQSDPSVDSIIREDITNGIAVALDAAALVGGGSNEPTGALSTSGIGSVSFSSAGAPTWAEIVSIESQITADNAETGNMSYVTTPALAGTLKSTVKGGDGSGRFISENGEVNGFPIYNTSSMTANNILLGSFSDLIVAQFGAVEVITQQNATTGVLDLGVHLLADVGVRRAEAFAKGA